MHCFQLKLYMVMLVMRAGTAAADPCTAHQQLRCRQSRQCACRLAKAMTAVVQLKQLSAALPQASIEIQNRSILYRVGAHVL